VRALLIAVAVLMLFGELATAQKVISPQQAAPSPVPSQPPSPSPREEVQSPQGKPGASQQPAASEQRGTEDRPAVVKILPAEKTADERAQEERDRIDKTSAGWWLRVLTGALVIVGAMQFLALIGQGAVFAIQAKRLRESVDLTRAIASREERDMRDAITTAQTSADAAKNSADAAALHAQAAIGVELPAIFVTQIILHARDLGTLAARLQYPEISITFENFGRTPAFLARSSVEVVLAKDLPESPVYATVVAYPPGTLIEKGTPYIINLQRREYSILEVEDIINGISVLWVYGFVSYRDFIKRSHKIGFCARLFCSDRPNAVNEFRLGYGPEGYTYDQ